MLLVFISSFLAGCLQLLHTSSYICFQKRENSKPKITIVTHQFFVPFCFVRLSEGSCFSIFGRMCVSTKYCNACENGSTVDMMSMNIEHWKCCCHTMNFVMRTTMRTFGSWFFHFWVELFYVSGAKQYIDFSFNPGWPWYRLYDGYLYIYCILFINFEFQASITFMPKFEPKNLRYAKKWVCLNDNYKNRLFGTS